MTPPKIHSLHTSGLLLMTLLCFACVGLAPAEAQAGPWTKKTGEYYVKFSELYFSSDTFVSPSGERIEGTDYLALTSAVYAELGLTERMHLQVFLPWTFSRNAFSEQGTRYATVGLGDAIVGVQTTPFKLGNLPWALRLESKIPLYDAKGPTGPDALNFPALGDGQVDLTYWLSLGGSLYPKPIYFLGEVGFRQRTEIFYGQGNGLEFANGIAYRAQAGYIFKESFLVAGNVNGVYTPTEDLFTQSFLTVGPAIGVKLVGGLWLEATVDPMIWSKNNAPGTTWSVGISHKRP